MQLLYLLLVEHDGTQDTLEGPIDSLKGPWCELLRACIGRVHAKKCCVDFEQLHHFVIIINAKDNIIMNKRFPVSSNIKDLEDIIITQ